MKEYISRRKKCELNLMVVCGPDHLIYYCSNRWPGGVNDSRIFRESALRELLESGKFIFNKTVIIKVNKQLMKKSINVCVCSLSVRQTAENFT